LKYWMYICEIFSEEGTRNYITGYNYSLWQLIIICTLYGNHFN